MISKTGNLEQRYEYSERAAKDLAKKLRLESGFKKDLRNFFDAMTDKLKVTYEQVGQVPPANLFETDLRKLLDKNYKIISKNFDSLLRMQTKAFDSIEYKAMDDDIRATVNGYNNRHSIQQANIITSTNQEDMAVSVAKVKQAALDKGHILSNKEIAAQAALVFKNKAFNRIDTIATTETQNIAEASKYIEAGFVEQNILNGLYQLNRRTKDFGSVKPTNIIYKTWITILDERTRLSHVLADEQKQPTNMPFIVEGQKLMTPGDSSLGASLDNLINCRCSCLYDVDELLLRAVQQPPIFSPESNLIPTDKDINQNDIVDNIVRGLPVGPNPATMIIENNGQQYAYIQGVTAKAGDVSPLGFVYEKDVFLSNSLFDQAKKRDRFFAPLNYQGKVVGYTPFEKIDSVYDNLYGRAYINLSDPKGREAFEKIKKGEIRGFDMPFSAPEPEDISKILSLEEAAKEGYDISTLNPDVKQVYVIKKANFEELRIQDPTDRIIFPKNQFEPIKINKPLPNGLTSLETPKLNIPENIKNGQNITIVEGPDGKKYGFVRGYATSFNSVDTYRGTLDRNEMAAHLNELKNNTRSIDMLYEHDNSKSIGYFPLRNMRVDDKGLYVEGFVDLDTEVGRQVFKEAKEGKLPGFSIGFSSDKFDSDYIQDVRIHKKYNLYEVSIVSDPANRQSLMLPVVGAEANIGRVQASEAFKLSQPKTSAIPLSSIQELKTQKDVDNFFLNKVFNDEVDYGKISLDDLNKIKTQEQLDDFLSDIREKRGLNFYTDLSDKPSIQTTTSSNIPEGNITRSAVPPIKDLEQETIVKNLLEGKPNVEDPPAIIVDYFGKPTSYFQGSIAVPKSVSSSGIVYTEEALQNAVSAYDKEWISVTYNGKKIGEIPASKLKYNSALDIAAYMNLDDPAIKEVFDKIRKGEIQGFGNSFKKVEKDDIVKTLTLEEAEKEGYDLSWLDPNVKEIQVVGKTDIEQISLADNPIFNRSFFTPINVNEPLPEGVTSLATPEFKVPENIKNGSAVTVVKDVNGKEHGFVRGYATVFNVVDSDRQLISKEKIIDSINRSIEDGSIRGLPMWYNHDATKEIGFFPLRNIRVDDYGVYVEGFIDLDKELGKQAYNEIKEGKFPAFSQGFNYSKYTTPLQDVDYIDSFVDIHEISVVPVPANPLALMKPVIGEGANGGRAKGNDVFKFTEVEKEPSTKEYQVA